MAFLADSDTMPVIFTTGGGKMKRKTAHVNIFVAPEIDQKARSLVDRELSGGLSEVYRLAIAFGLPKAEEYLTMTEALRASATGSAAQQVVSGE